MRRRRPFALAVGIACALIPAAFAQPPEEPAPTSEPAPWAPYERVDLPVVIDPAVCPLWLADIALGLGSERIVVAGFDADGACIVEVVGETEGNWFHDVCRVPSDAPPFRWRPTETLGVQHGFPGTCVRIGEGNSLIPGGDDGPEFPATLPFGTTPP